jgi:hypothetical protein
MSPAAAALGLAPDERAVILHADDVGMCQASIPAFIELAESGGISSASAMVPCPWFSEVARYCRSNPFVDMGVHLTLTSEWAGLRWAPISTVDPRSGLIDETGHFHSRREQALEKGIPDAVCVELRAQLTRARSSGIDVTHLDAHMFTAMRPPFTQLFLRLGADEGLPTLDSADHIAMLPSGDPGKREQQFRTEVDAMPPGLTHMLIHPAIDTPELRQMTPAWRERVADFEFFRGGAAKEYLRHADVRVVGYRALRDALRRP